MEAITHSAQFGPSLLLSGFDVLVWEVDRETRGFRRLYGPLVQRLGREALRGSFVEEGVLCDTIDEVARDGLPRACRHSIRGLDGSLYPLYSQILPVGGDRIAGLSVAIGEERKLPDPDRPSSRGEAQADAILETIAEGVLAARPNGEILYANAAAARLLGFRSAEALMKQTARELLDQFVVQDEFGRPVPPEEMPPEKAARGQMVTPQAMRWRYSDGRELFWAMVRATPVFDEAGQVQQVITIWRDITEQKRQEHSLNTQKAILEAETEASPDGILLVGPSGEILSTNRRFLEIWGLNEEALDERSDNALLERVLPKLADPDGFLTRVRDLYGATDSARDEFRLKDGRILVRHSSVVRGPDGVSLARIWFFRDVTETERARERERLLELERTNRAAAERAQRASSFLAEASRLLSKSLDLRALLSGLAAVTSDHFRSWTMIDVMHSDGRFTRIAEAPSPGWKHVARDLEGRMPSDPRALFGRRFNHFEPELVQGMPELLEEGIRRLPWLLGQWDRNATRMLSKVRLRSYLAVPIHSGGKLLGSLTLGWGRGQPDLSNEVRQLAEDLAARIALAVENAELYEASQQAVTARDEFLSVASHELRTPISTIQLLSQGILHYNQHLDGSRLPDWVVPRLQTIERQCRRLGILVARLLDVTRLMSGRVELERKPTDLSEVTREILDAHHEEIAAAGCTVTLHADREAMGMWDRARLEQVVTNLITNATKYGAGKPLDIRVGHRADTAFLEVTDHGIGIPQEALSRIFERFERAVDTRHYAGLGLGLYIVRQLVDAMGGRIDVYSAPGQGSTFRVELPTHAAARLADAEQPRAS